MTRLKHRLIFKWGSEEAVSAFLEKNCNKLRNRMQNISKAKYTQKRIQHWNKVAELFPPDKARYYHRRIEEIYRFLVPSKQKVLELGCGSGSLLSALEPDFGVGVDFSKKMIARALHVHTHLRFVCADSHNVSFSSFFDVIIMNDLLNDVWDVQQIFNNISKFCHADTRVVLNVFSRLWQPALDVTRNMGWATPLLRQNWLTPEDLKHLMHLEGFEVIKQFSDILLPVEVPVLSSLCNKFLSKLFPLRFFNLSHFLVARKIPGRAKNKFLPSVSVVVPARNEAGNIPSIVKRIPKMGSATEIIFVEGGSTDNTYATIKSVSDEHNDLNISFFKQQGSGKGDAVRLGFSKASGEVLMILDADMTVPPEDLPLFFNALVNGKGEFINGVRLVYPMQDQAMRFFNLVGNKFFSLAFSWMLGQPVKDTLCGTKVLTKKNYELIAANRAWFGDFDPFGDFDLLFGAAKQNLKIIDLPIRYHERTYGETNIRRWKHGAILLKMVFFAAKRIKFI